MKKKEKIKQLEHEVSLLTDSMIEHALASSIFQPDGKYYKEANLPLGSSCVVEGIKWMDQKIDQLKNEKQLIETKYECLLRDYQDLAEEKDELLKSLILEQYALQGIIKEQDELNKKQPFDPFKEYGFEKQKQICLHKTCQECKGRGIKKNGDYCFHYISCPCKKCSPFIMFQ